VTYSTFIRVGICPQIFGVDRRDEAPAVVFVVSMAAAANRADFERKLT
jgi:hypothetical protein